MPLRLPTRRSCRSGSVCASSPQARAITRAVSWARCIADATTTSGFFAARYAATASACRRPLSLRPTSDSAPWNTCGFAVSAWRRRNTRVCDELVSKESPPQRTANITNPETTDQKPSRNRPGLAPADYREPVIEFYMSDVDRPVLRENLKLTIERRIRKAQTLHASIERWRGVARRSHTSPSGREEQ